MKCWLSSVCVCRVPYGTVRWRCRAPVPCVSTVVYEYILLSFQKLLIFRLAEILSTADVTTVLASTDIPSHLLVSTQYSYCTVYWNLPYLKPGVICGEDSCFGLSFFGGMPPGSDMESRKIHRQMITLKNQCRASRVSRLLLNLISVHKNIREFLNRSKAWNSRVFACLHSQARTSGQRRWWDRLSLGSKPDRATPSP